MKNITLLLISLILVSGIFAQQRKGGKRSQRPRTERMMPKHRNQMQDGEHRRNMRKRKNGNDDVYEND